MHQEDPSPPSSLKVCVFGREGRVEGLFVLDRYLADQDCIWMDNKWISKSGFEKAAGSTTAKWHCSIKVSGRGKQSLGAWLEQRGIPIHKGPSRKSRQKREAEESSARNPQPLLPHLLDPQPSGGLAGPYPTSAATPALLLPGQPSSLLPHHPDQGAFLAEGEPYLEQALTGAGNAGTPFATPSTMFPFLHRVVSTSLADPLPLIPPPMPIGASGTAAATAAATAAPLPPSTAAPAASSLLPLPSFPPRARLATFPLPSPAASLPLPAVTHATSATPETSGSAATDPTPLGPRHGRRPSESCSSGVAPPATAPSNYPVMMGYLAPDGSSGLLRLQQQQQQASVWGTHASPAIAAAPTVAVGTAASPAIAQHYGVSAVGSSSPQGAFDALALAQAAVQQPQQLTATADAPAPLLPQSSDSLHDYYGGGDGDVRMAVGGGGGGGGAHVSVTDAWVAVEGEDVAAYLRDDPP